MKNQLKTEKGVQAGSHTYENLVPPSEIDNTNFKVKVVAHWCEQATDAEDAVVTVISNLPNPLPGEDPDRREDKWVLIDGEYYLPINDGKGNETKAEVWYYTDENMDAVIGYNDKYITLMVMKSILQVQIPSCLYKMMMRQAGNLLLKLFTIQYTKVSFKWMPTRCFQYMKVVLHQMDFTITP